MRISLFQSGQNQFQVGRGRLRISFFLEVVGADQQDDRSRMQREHVFVQADEHTARGVAADAAVGHFHPGKAPAKIVTPHLGDGIAEENDRALIPLDLLGPGTAAFDPEFAEPIIAADGPGAGQTVIGRGNLEMRIRCRRGGRLRQAGQAQETGGKEKRKVKVGFHGLYERIVRRLFA